MHCLEWLDVWLLPVVQGRQKMDAWRVSLCGQLWLPGLDSTALAR